MKRLCLITPHARKIPCTGQESCLRPRHPERLHHDQLSFSYQPLLLSDGREAVWINFDIFGVIFMTEMLIRGEQARAELIPPEVEQHFNISVV